MNGQQGNKIKIARFVIGSIGTNCYVVSDRDTKEAFLVDAAACPPELVSYIRNSGLCMQGVLLTHGHFDHILGIDSFLKEFPVPVYAHERERELLEDAALNASASYGEGYTFHKAHYLRDGSKLQLAGRKIQVIYTPGHTAGGCCYYLPEEGVLFSGDTLFHSSIGRTDLPTGSSSQLIRSIKDKLLALPPATRVYPGHMEETTIEYEQKYNPFL